MAEVTLVEGQVVLMLYVVPPSRSVGGGGGLAAHSSATTSNAQSSPERVRESTEDEGMVAITLFHS